MRAIEAKRLRAALAAYARPSTPLALALFAATLAVYGLALAGALLFPFLALRLLCSIAAGATIASLFVIGHDAAHGAFTASRALNGTIGRIAFLPALHNYSLWQVQHNRLHHRLVNLKGFNSWSPLTKAEFDALPAWRHALERLYRGPLGFAPYYLRERWWRDKFFPRRARDRTRMSCWLDFALVSGAACAFIAALALSGGAEAVVFGFALPFLVWNAMMGATTYMQHTHTRVPWFEALEEWRGVGGQDEVTVQVEVPRWYGFISHHIMDHPAHHAHPKIPLYRLAAAQRELNRPLGSRAVRQRFSPAYLWRTLASCKLYDYRQHRWLDFAGNPTSPCTLPTKMQEAATVPAVA
jgi:acyl-lipid omega-6 desaturase (Delta-12 desaturase)